MNADTSGTDPAGTTRKADLPSRLTQAIRNFIEAYEPVDGYTQWYVDDLCIDCWTDEFWPAVEQALRKALDG